MIFRIKFDKKKKKIYFRHSVIFGLEMLLKKEKEKVVNTNYEREGRRTKDISVI